MSFAIFICGHSGCGKTTLARRLVPALAKSLRRSFCLIDKDTVSNPLSARLMEELTGTSLDRDSPVFKEHVRDLEYRATLDVADENLRLGVNVLLPGPWTGELLDGRLFGPPAGLGLTPKSNTLVIWMDASERLRKGRIVRRANPRDRFKLEHWDEYEAGLITPNPADHPQMVVVDAEEPFPAAKDKVQAAIRAVQAATRKN